MAGSFTFDRRSAMSLDGKHALVTGSSRGIGRGTALKLGGKGVKVAIHYHKNEAAAKDTPAKLRKLGSDGIIIQADICRPEEVSRMFGRVKSEFGKLDVFVSNARPDVPEFYQGPMNITLDQWDTALNSQAKAFLVAVREVCRMMDDGGRIVAITYAPGGRTGSWNRKSTRLNSSHSQISYAVFCLKKKKKSNADCL